jgi:hypothetical protein
VITVIVLEPEVSTDGGLKLADALPGSPLTLKSTTPVKPFVGTTVTV